MKKKIDNITINRNYFFLTITGNRLRKLLIVTGLPTALTNEGRRSAERHAGAVFL